MKKYILPITLFLFTICLFFFSSNNLVAAREGLSLWATSVVPSLFPFFVATELLSQTSMPYILGRIFNIFMRPMFNVGGEGSFAFIMGLISGYPVGAKIACNFRNNNILPKVECERLLSFTNNSGPLFIIGTVGISMFGNSAIGLLLLITHIFACITVGFIFRFWNGSLKKTSRSVSLMSTSMDTISFSSLGESIANSISNATSTILMIGGFVVMFSVIISIFKTSHLLNMVSTFFTPWLNFLHIPSTFVNPFITGILEITNGISLIATINIKAISVNIILTSFLLGFGGISVFLQVLSITSKTDLSIKPYLIGKILQGFIAGFYTYLFIQIFPMFNFNL